MNEEEKREIAQLLPWFINGSLREEEAQRVRAALEDSPELRSQLEDLKQFAQAVVARPDTEALVAFAEQGPSDASKQAVADYLAGADPAAADDAVLVELARLGLATAEEEAPGPATTKSSESDGDNRQLAALPRSNTSSAPWRQLAVAASVLAVAGWVSFALNRPGSENAAPVESMPFVELAPLQTIRSAADEAPASTRGRAAVLLLVEEQVVADSWVVAAIDGDGNALARWPVAPPENGVTTVLLDPARLPAACVGLALIARVGDSERTVHQYRLP